VIIRNNARSNARGVLLVPTNRTYISRDVVFDESIFSYSQIPSDSTLPSTSTLPLRSDQFVEAAYTPALLANHGAGRHAHLKLLDDGPETQDENGYSAGRCGHVHLSRINLNGTTRQPQNISGGVVAPLCA
jgi:hypothetical protein